MKDQSMGVEAWLSLLATPEPAELIVRPRTGTESLAALEARWIPLQQALPASAVDYRALQALILLWHDHWEAAHERVQESQTPDGWLVHALVHRREPDPWNAKYWWRRTGSHRALRTLSQRTRPWFRQSGLESWSERLIREGVWNPFEFVDLIGAVLAAGDPALIRHARALQQIEFETVLLVFLGADGFRISADSV